MKALSITKSEDSISLQAKLSEVELLTIMYALYDYDNVEAQDIFSSFLQVAKQSNVIDKEEFEDLV